MRKQIEVLEDKIKVLEQKSIKSIDLEKFANFLKTQSDFNKNTVGTFHTQDDFNKSALESLVSIKHAIREQDERIKKLQDGDLKYNPKKVVINV